MSIRFIYESGDKLADREDLALSVFDYLKTQINIPENIELVFAIMNDHEYGSTFVNPRFKNRIKVNNKLTVKELPYVLVHELLHLEQIKTGRLSNTSNGNYIWGGRVYDTPRSPDMRFYQSLPWELDVVQKQRPLFDKVLQFLAASKT